MEAYLTIAQVVFLTIGGACLGIAIYRTIIARASHHGPWCDEPGQTCEWCR